MLLELYKPDEFEAVTDILRSSVLNTDDPDPIRKKRKMQMQMVHTETLARYAAQYLSDPNYLNNVTNEQEKGFLEFSARAGALGKTEAEKALLGDAMKLVRQNPHLSKTFGIISEIAYQYFHDLDCIAQSLSQDPEDEIAKAAEEMFAEAGIGFFSRELLLYMFYGISQQVRGVESISGVFERALNNAKGKGAFKVKGTCPFGSKISSLLDIAPIREPETGRLHVLQNETCALPTFIFNEILTDLKQSIIARPSQEAA